MDTSNWIALSGVVVAAIGVVVGAIGKKELNEANNLKVEIGKLSAKIDKLEVSNSQIANTINNNGLGYKDTSDLIDEKTKNVPRVVVASSEPSDKKDGDVWIGD